MTVVSSLDDDSNDDGDGTIYYDDDDECGDYDYNVDEILVYDDNGCLW